MENTVNKSMPNISLPDALHIGTGWSVPAIKSDLTFIEFYTRCESKEELIQYIDKLLIAYYSGFIKLMSGACYLEYNGKKCDLPECYNFYTIYLVFKKYEKDHPGLSEYLDYIEKSYPLPINVFSIDNIHIDRFLELHIRDEMPKYLRDKVDTKFYADPLLFYSLLSERRNKLSEKSENCTQSQGNNSNINCTTTLESSAKFCSKCGTGLQNSQKFCPKCGNKIESNINDDSTNTFTQFNMANSNLYNKKNNKPAIAISIISIIIILILGVIFVPKLIKSPEDYMLEANYQKAYEKSDLEEKDGICKENLTAYVSNMCVDSLKDSKSFELRDAWVNYGEDNTRQIVLKVAANNSYGNTVINYWLYAYDSDKEEYCLFSSVSDLDEEEYYSWQDADEKVEIALENAVRKRIIEIKSDSTTALDDESIDRINELYTTELLDDVELLLINR